MRHPVLLRRIAALEAAPSAQKPLRIVGGLPPHLMPAAGALIRIGPMAVVGGLPPLPGTEIIMPHMRPEADAA